MLLQLIEAHLSFKILVFTQAITRLLRYFFYLSCYFSLFLFSLSLFHLQLLLTTNFGNGIVHWDMDCIINLTLFLISNFDFDVEKNQAACLEPTFASPPQHVSPLKFIRGFSPACAFVNKGQQRPAELSRTSTELCPFTVLRRL